MIMYSHYHKINSDRVIRIVFYHPKTVYFCDYRPILQYILGHEILIGERNCIVCLAELKNGLPGQNGQFI